MNKLILTSLSVVGISGIAIGGYFLYDSQVVTANPDYICTAKFVNPVCEITSYSEWVDGKRTWYGTQKVSLTYSSSRVSCDGTNADGVFKNDATVYNQYAWQITDLTQTEWAELSEVTQQYNASVTTQACSIVETDNTNIDSTLTVSGSLDPSGTWNIVDSEIESDE